MIIIVDANVLFSALIKDSKTRDIILRSDEFFLFPSYVFIEMEKHKKEILKKSKMDKKSFDKLLQLILNKVLIIPDETLIPHRKEAFEIVKYIFELDIPILLGSDAHKPDDLAHNFEMITKKLKQIGFNQLAHFNKRKRTFIEI